MLTNNVYHTHPLYLPLTRWQGVDSTNYFMLNDSLMAAHRYIESYGVGLTLSQHSPTINYYQNKLSLSNNTKVLSLFSNGKLIIPSVEYYDTVENTFKLTDGVDMNNLPNATYKALGLSGYVIDTTEVDTLLKNTDGFIPEVFTITTYDDLNLTAVGKKDSEVFINNESFGTIGEDGTLDITIPINEATDTLHVIIDDEESTIQLIKVDAIATEVNVVVTGYDTVINSTTLTLVVVSDGTTAVNVNGVQTNLTKGVNTLTLTVEEKDGAINVDGSYFPYTFKNISNEQVAVINKNTTTLPYLPEDIKLAIFKLAQHFYNTTLYNSEGRSTMNALDERTSFLPTSIPKEVHRLLAPYVTYG